MTADPEVVARELGKLDSEIRGTEAVLAGQEAEVQETRKRLTKLYQDKADFEKDVASVGGVG